MEYKGREIRVIVGNIICRGDRGRNVGSVERGRDVGRDIAGNIICRGDRGRNVGRDGIGRNDGRGGGERETGRRDVFAKAFLSFLRW